MKFVNWRTEAGTFFGIAGTCAAVLVLRNIGIELTWSTVVWCLGLGVLCLIIASVKGETG